MSVATNRTSLKETYNSHVDARMSEHSRVLSRGVLSGSGCVRPGSRHFLCALVVTHCCCCLAAAGSGWASDANSWLLSSACTIDRVPLQAIDVHSFNLQYLERRPVVLEGTDQALFAAATEKVRFRCTIFERCKDSACPLHASIRRLTAPGARLWHATNSNSTQPYQFGITLKYGA